MALSTQSTTTSNGPFGPEHMAKISWWLKTSVAAPIRYGEPTWKPLSVECPECGHTTDDGICYSFDCVIGFNNVQVEVGREIPEDWLMVEVEPREGEDPLPYSPCPECGEETDQGGACWNRWCPDGSMNIGDKQYHEMVDLFTMDLAEVA